MSKEQLSQVESLIDKDRWQDMLDRFIDVLKINIFTVDYQGRTISVPVKERFGWSFFEKYCLSPKEGSGPSSLLGSFQKTGNYFECVCMCGLQSFMIPISVEQKLAFAYLIVGPVALNKKEDSAFYKKIANANEINFNDLMDAVNEVRVVSHVTMKSTLDLLSEVAKDVVELNLEKKKLSQIAAEQEGLPKEISEEAKDIYRTIHIDEMLITLLDLALKMTKTECGSIFVLDKDKKELFLKVSRGIDESILHSNFSIKLGNGIAGLAAKENTSFVIHGKKGENRIKKFLRRPEIKHSIIMPIDANNMVVGVLNLHTKKESNDIEDGVNNLQYLKKLFAAAFQSI